MPHHTFSLWNNYQVHPRIGAGLGVLHRSDMFATIDNTVTLPGYTRVDAAAFVTLSRDSSGCSSMSRICSMRTTTSNADSNTNISPGFPRAVRVG